jgi:hypothetical protein
MRIGRLTLFTCICYRYIYIVTLLKLSSTDIYWLLVIVYNLCLVRKHRLFNWLNFCLPNSWKFIVCTAFRRPVGIYSSVAAGSMKPELVLYTVLIFRSLLELELWIHSRNYVQFTWIYIVIDSPALNSRLKIGQNAITHRPNYFRRLSQSLYRTLSMLI